MARKTRNCPVCGNAFKPAYPSQKYCCEECARQAAAAQALAAKVRRRVIANEEALYAKIDEAEKRGLSYGYYTVYRELGWI